MIRQHAVAVVAAIQAGTPGIDVYDADSVPMLPEYPYIVVFVSRRNGERATNRLDGDTDTKAWRVVTMFVGSTADEARWCEERTELALERTRLMVAHSVGTTPMRFESSSGLTRDTDVDNLFSGSHVWTYTTTDATAVA